MCASGGTTLTCALTDAIFAVSPLWQVLVYGDCAVNVEPSAEDLAQARRRRPAFGLPWRLPWAALLADTALRCAGCCLRAIAAATSAAGAGPSAQAWCFAVRLSVHAGHRRRCC